MKENSKPSRIEADSVIYNKIVPGLLIVMGVIMGILIIIALGVLLGFVPFK